MEMTVLVTNRIDMYRKPTQIAPILCVSFTPRPFVPLTSHFAATLSHPKASDFFACEEQLNHETFHHLILQNRYVLIDVPER